MIIAQLIVADIILSLIYCVAVDKFRGEK